MRSNVTLVGCNGLNDQTGISTSQINEARINRKIIQNSGQVIVLADYTKLGKSSNFTVGSIDDVDILITDSFADPKLIAKFEKMVFKSSRYRSSFQLYKTTRPHHDKSW